MNSSRKLAVMAASFFSLGLICSLAIAQVPQGQNSVRPMNYAPTGGVSASAPNIALLDVSYLFKNHPRFKAMMDEMKADVEREEANVNRDRDSIRKLAEQLETFRKGSPDYKAMEEDIAKKEAALTVNVQRQRKEFLERESKIYLSVYQEITQEVDYYCANKGIDMVLRFNGDPVDPEKPDSILSNINKPVVWYDKSRDITGDILKSIMSRNGGQQPAGAPRMGNQPARPGTPTGYK